MRHARMLSAAAGALVLCAVASPALGDTELVRASPKQGTAVRHLPKTIVLTYAGPLLRLDGARVRLGNRSDRTTSARLNPRDARQVVLRTRGDQPGSYTVEWGVVAADGHPLAGRFTFRVSRGR